MIPFTKTYPEATVIDIHNAVSNEPVELTVDIEPTIRAGTTSSLANINIIKVYVAPVYNKEFATEYVFNIRDFPAMTYANYYGGSLSVNKNGIATLRIGYADARMIDSQWEYIPDIQTMRSVNAYYSNIMDEPDGIPGIYIPDYSRVAFSEIATQDMAATCKDGKLYIRNTQYTDPDEFAAYIRYIIYYYKRKEYEKVLSTNKIITSYGQNYVWAETYNNSILISEPTICDLNCSTYDISEYRAMLQQNNPQHIRVTFIADNIVFEDDEFSADGFNLTSYMNPDVDLTFGVAFMSEVRLNFMRSTKTDQLNWTREFKVELGVEDDNEAINWIDVGIFAGNRPILTTKEVIEFTAYDRMQRFDKNAIDFINLLTYPCTLQDVYNKLCKFIGVGNVLGDEIQDIMGRGITYDIMHKRNFSSCRELLAEIAGATGCYAKTTTDGQVKLVWFEDHTDVYNLDRNDIFNIDSTDLAQVEGERWQEITRFKWQDMSNYRWEEFYDRGIPLAMQGITAIWTDTDETVTQPPDVNAGAKRSWNEIMRKTWDDMRDTTWYDAENLGWKGNICTVTDNPFMYYEDELDIRSHLQKIVNRIMLFPMYFIANISAVGDWLVEPGDVISLELEDGSYVSYPIFSRVLAWNGSCECDYESTGSLVR